MLEPYAAVVVYDPGLPKEANLAQASLVPPSYCVLAHNLSRWDAQRVADRVAKQYDHIAHVVYHRNRHDGSGAAPPPQAAECSVCRLLVEEIMEKASVMRRSKAANAVPNVS